MAPPETQEFSFYRSEAPVVLEEAREALAVLKHYMRDQETPANDPPEEITRH